jgi:membrane-associated phospholipid phosphatase
MGQGKKFFFNFAPLVLLLFSYESLRGLAPYLNHKVHYMEMIDFDRWIGGGTIPTAHLQHWLYHGYLQWYDFYFYFLYMGHFLFPVLLAVYIWMRHGRQFLRFMVSLVTLSYLGFLTYVLFPAAPPWLASDKHLIPAIHGISSQIWWAMGVHNYWAIYHQVNPNQVAAMPSLHSAYPTLFLLFIYRIKGWKWALPFSIYPLSIWFGVIYMGEHYLIDVLVGILYAIVVYWVMMRLFDKYEESMLSRWERFKKKTKIRFRSRRRASKKSAS